MARERQTTTPRGSSATHPTELRPSSSAQSFVAAVEALVDVTEKQRLTALTDEDRQRLVAARAKLSDVVGPEENRFRIPLIVFIDNLIKNLEEESGMETRKLRRTERTCRPEPRPHFKLADLLAQEAEDGSDSQTFNKQLKPRRPEKVGRPANRTRVRSASRLRKETEDDAYGEVDTGGPVGKELW